MQDVFLHTVVYVTKCFFAETDGPNEWLRTKCRKISQTATYYKPSCRIYYSSGVFFHVLVSKGVCYIFANNCSNFSHDEQNTPQRISALRTLQTASPESLEKDSDEDDTSLEQLKPPQKLSLLPEETEESSVFNDEKSGIDTSLAFAYLRVLAREFQFKYKDIPNPQRDWKHFMTDLQEQCFRDYSSDIRRQKAERKPVLRSDNPQSERKSRRTSFSTENAEEAERSHSLVIETSDVPEHKKKQNKILKFLRKNLKVFIWFFALVIILTALILGAIFVDHSLQ